MKCNKCDTKDALLMLNKYLCISDKCENYHEDYAKEKKKKNSKAREIDFDYAYLACNTTTVSSDSSLIINSTTNCDASVTITFPSIMSNFLYLDLCENID